MDLPLDEPPTAPVGPPTARQVDPDLVRRSWSREWMGVAVVALVLALVAGLVALLASVSMAGGLATFEARATGTVTKVNAQHSTDPQHDTCAPSYRFTVDGTTYSGSSSQASEALCVLRVGDPIDVTYDPSGPATGSEVAAYYVVGSSATVMGIAIRIAGLLFVFSIVSVVLAVRRKR